ncbi:MAG: PhoH family protein [Elusimicrobia bacterium]|nr:PhoH family protein [Elusimicrobiota bacterium]
MKKTFVLDTNVLIHDPDSLFSFADNTVVLPLAVIEELDNLKSYPDERGRNARLISRRLDELRKRGKISQGIPNDSGGMIRIETQIKADIPTSLVKKADNQIMSVALGLKKEGERVIFISKDINMRVKAEVLGLEVQDFEKAKVKFEELYSGWREITVEDKVLNEFHLKKEMPLPSADIHPQEFVLLKARSNDKKTGLARCAPKENKLVKLVYDDMHIWGINALNLEQKFAFEALLNEEIKLVTLLGIAGTGKTLIALAAGLFLTFEKRFYRKVLISRPIVPMGKDIGYLPGTKEEKLSNWMGAFYDNLEFLVDRSGLSARKGMHENQGKKDKRRDNNDHGPKLPELVETLFMTGKIEVEALTYLRGRSIPEQFMVIDEAQNLTPNEVKTIVSRAGKDTKVVLTGDPYQIDNPYLDSSSNGLTYLADKFKGQDIFAHITLNKSERSYLAGLAAELL